jgi:mannose-6-phosphate isomerase-like protein (cupin superfamily)
MTTDENITRTRLARSSKERFQLLRRELGIEGFGLNLILLQSRERGRIHTHSHQEEVYLVMEGLLTLMIEGTAHELGPDEIVRVPASVRRQLVNEGPERVVLLAFGGSGQHAGRDGHAWVSWDESGPGRSPQETPLPENLPPD